MAENIPQSLSCAVKNAKILLVGAGGIGCEVLKNLTLTGFTDIVVVRLNSEKLISKITDHREARFNSCDNN